MTSINRDVFTMAVSDPGFLQQTCQLHFQTKQGSVKMETNVHLQAFQCGHLNKKKHRLFYIPMLVLEN